MTNEEAIIDIRENIQPIVGGKSLDIAISAIEKQIPKKPIEDTAYLTDFKTFHCPVYNKNIVSRLDGEWIAGRPQKYCEDCGQALKWGIPNDR